MSVLLALLVVISFSVLLERMRVIGRAREAKTIVADCLDVLRDRQLTDRAKERALQGTAIRLFQLSGRMVGLSLVALLIPLGVVFVLDYLSMASLSDVMVILQRWDFLLASALLGVICYHASRVIVRA